MNNKGFTLIEMLVALAIFSIVIVLVLGAFVHSFASQKKIIEMQVVQREGAYLMETLSREIRMASAIDASQLGTTGHSVAFNNHNNVLTTYCRANASGGCDAAGDFFASNGEIMSSSEIKITNLIFNVSEDIPPKRQPLIIVSMTLQSVNDPEAKIILQTSVAMRIY